MHIRKLAVSSLALVIGMAFAGFAGAAPDTATADAPKATQKACCQHHGSADGKTGMHCNHAKATAQGEEGTACCAKHAAMHKDGDAPADTRACCAKHAAMMKEGATAESQASCAKHAAMHEDGAKSCCCAAACPHHAEAEAPAKS